MDAFTRIHLQELLLSVWQRNWLTMVLVTHDVDEALYLSDQVVVFSERPALVSEILHIDLARPRDRREPELLRLAASAGEAAVGVSQACDPRART